MADVVGALFTLQLLLTVAAFMARAVRAFGRYRQQLRLNYAIVTLAFAAWIAQPLLPSATYQPLPSVNVWAAPTLKAFDQKPVAATVASAPAPADHAFLFVVGLGLGALLVALWWTARDLLRLLRLARGAFEIRRLGRVRILASEGVAVPFSFRRPGAACVVVPFGLLSRPRELKLVLQHELQHHRQRDTLWAYPLFVINSISFFNPLVRAWMAWIGEVQEFACDEALLDVKRADPREYASCLYRAAQTAFGPNSQPVCATGLLFGRRRKLTSRRIQYMFSQNKSASRWLRPFALVATTFVLGGTAYASKDWIQDRRITGAQAEEMAAVARKRSDFPVVVNPAVVRALNRYLGTAEGRKFIDDGIRRLESHRQLVTDKIRTYGHPAELMAVPLIESGYENLPPNNKVGYGAGLWMFIASTARNFGLRVDRKADQRLDVTLESDAAMRYLGANYLRFGDWALALLAYNVGESRVQECIDTMGTRDAWALIDKGCEGDRDYLARVMAGVLILANR